MQEKVVGLKIADKFSDILSGAVDDLEVIEKMPEKYKVDMKEYHSNHGQKDGICLACLGGAVFARAVNYDTTIDYDEVFIKEELRLATIALDKARLYDWRYALDKIEIHVSEDIEDQLFEDLDNIRKEGKPYSYEKNAKGFKANMRAAAAIFKKYGL